MRVRACLVLAGLLGCVGGVGVALPAVAGAYATVVPAPVYSSVPGLPDGRVYEQVSPANKHGYGVGTPEIDSEMLAGASGEGDAILYEGEGPLAEGSTSGVFQGLFVSQRSSTGWVTRAAMPRGAPGLHEPEENNSFFEQGVGWVLPSADLSRLAFTIKGADVGFPDKSSPGGNLFLEGSDPFVEPVWVARPQIEQSAMGRLDLVGGTPDLGRLYFGYGGTLLAGDPAQPGFYEYRDGVLSDAGVLPDGTVSEYGAIPAALGSVSPLSENTAHEITPSENPDQTDGQVSADGLRAFFVSPAAPGAPTPPELYVLETAADGSQRTVLVSQSQLPGHVGEAAPNGALAVATAAPTPHGVEKYPGYPSYVFASADGSHAFFQSIDRLTEAAPSTAVAKVYEFDLETGSLEYLPGVTGSIVAAAVDGSSFVFENTASTPDELDRWVAGSDGGSVAPIAQLPGPAECSGMVCLESTHVVAGGSVVVFATQAPIAGFNDGGGSQQIFRYDASSNELGCISCPPVGIAPAGEAVMSMADHYESYHEATFSEPNSVVDDRGVSANGSRVFFDTPDPLVAQDVNGKRDVYEWEDGRVFLLSSGSSVQDSFYLDSSESGDDVFFETSSELTPGDNDGAYDVYDARVPRPGDILPPAAVPCQGEVCQGPPSVPQLLSAPASATFYGLGNINAPQAGGKGKPKSATRPAKKKGKAKTKRRVRSRHSKKADKAAAKGVARGSHGGDRR